MQIIYLLYDMDTETFLNIIEEYSLKNIYITIFRLLHWLVYIFQIKIKEGEKWT